MSILDNSNSLEDVLTTLEVSDLFRKNNSFMDELKSLITPEDFPAYGGVMLTYLNRETFAQILSDDYYKTISRVGNGYCFREKGIDDYRTNGSIVETITTYKINDNYINKFMIKKTYHSLIREELDSIFVEETTFDQNNNIVNHSKNLYESEAEIETAKILYKQ